MNTTSYDKLQRVNCLANELDRLYHTAARKLGVSDSVLCILYLIYEKGDGCLLYDICSESGLHKQTINSALRNLEKDGILYLEQDRGKSKRIRLTEKGKLYTERTAARLYEAESNAFSHWTEEELGQYLRCTKKHIDTFREEIQKIDETTVPFRRKL